MQWFVRALHTKQDELMSDVFELMASFGYASFTADTTQSVLSCQH